MVRGRVNRMLMPPYTQERFSVYISILTPTHCLHKPIQYFVATGTPVLIKGTCS